jgi:cytochrome P450
MRLKFALGEGLLTAPIDIWSQSRKAISPSFHASALRGFMASFNKRANWMTTDWTQRIAQANESGGSGCIRIDVSLVTPHYICTVKR